MYFQIPLMVLVILPALEGLRPAWREAAANLGARTWQYWRYVGGPVLMPSFLGCVLLLFGSALSAYATAQALTSGTHPADPDPDRLVPERQRAGRPGERRQGAGPGHGADHRDRHGRSTRCCSGGRRNGCSNRRRSCAGEAGPGPHPVRPAAAQLPVWRWIILVLAGVYFVIPLYAALRFAGIARFRSVVHQAGFSARPDRCRSGSRSITTVLTLVLMVPTAIYVHLRLPRLRRLLESDHDPADRHPAGGADRRRAGGVAGLASRARRTCSPCVYVVLAMPFAYRSLDAGLRALDLKTLVEASNSLGAGWPTTLWRVILPNLRTALLSATVLTVALVLGEFTMASLDQYQTFPVWIVAFDQTSGPISVAASLLALFVTWIVAAADLDDRRPARPRRTGGGQVDLFSVARREPPGGPDDGERRRRRRRGHRGRGARRSRWPRAASGGAPVSLTSREPALRRGPGAGRADRGDRAR